jgi:hypothetical protein
MTLMELSAILGNFGEFAGAILLFGSLVYVGIQIKQNTSATRAQIYQARTDSAQQMFLFVAGSDEVTEIMETVEYGNTELLDQLSPVQRRRYLNFMLANQLRMDNSFYQYQNGFLDEEYYDHGISNVIRTHAHIWRDLNLTAPRPSFEKEVERLIAEHHEL